jgi:hypothetical protein
MEHRAGQAFATCAVDGRIQTSEPVNSEFDQVSDILSVAHVGSHVQSMLRDFEHLSGKGLALLVPPPGNDNARAVAVENESYAPSEAGNGACQENDFVCHF